MNPLNTTWAQRMAGKGRDQNLREYQQLKEADEMERAGTIHLYEHLRSKHGEEGAREILKQRGYNLALLPSSRY